MSKELIQAYWERPAMNLPDLERIGQAVTQVLGDRDDAAVGGSLALHRHGLTRRQSSDKHIDVYGSKDACVPALRAMVDQHNIRYHVRDLEFCPSLISGVKVIDLRDSVVLQAQKAAGPNWNSLDLSYLADIHAALGRNGIDTILARSSLASKVSDSLPQVILFACEHRKDAYGNLTRRHLESLSRDLELFKAASMAANHRKRYNQLVQEMLALRKEAATRPSLIGRLTNRNGRQLEGATQRVIRQREAVERLERNFIRLATERFRTGPVPPGLEGRPDVRREGLPTPSTAYELAYAQLISKTLLPPYSDDNVAPTYENAIHDPVLASTPRASRSGEDRNPQQPAPDPRQSPQNPVHPAFMGAPGSQGPAANLSYSQPTAHSQGQRSPSPGRR